MEVERKLEALGLVLPPPVKIPPGLELPFAFVRVRGRRAYVAGHGPQSPDGSIGGPFGKVGAEVSVPEAYQAARRTALSNAMGLTVNHVAAVSVPISAGFLWAHLGYRTVFWAGAALAVASILGALRLPPQGRDSR